MAKFSFLFFLFLLLLLPTLSQASKTTNNEPLHVSAISNALSSKGYNEMSLTLLDMTFKALLSTQQSLNTTITVFCPTDKAFYSLNYRHDPFTLLQYQIAPSNLDKETLENSLPYGSKIDTLLHGHPQVVTKLPGDTNTSINGVNIVDWDIYHDGQVILHGVDDFFDPAFQILKYSWYDDVGVTNNQEDKDLESEAVYIIFSVYSALVVLTFGLAYLLYVYYDECREDTDDHIEYV